MKYNNSERSIIIFIFTIYKHVFSGSGVNSFISHSLSWSRKSETSSSGTMFAKVWTPEDPRMTKYDANYE